MERAWRWAAVGLGVVVVVAGAALRWGSRIVEIPGYDGLGVIEGPRTTAPPPTGTMNVVLVIGCTVRKDQTTVYAPELATTPFLASLAARGAVFDDLITAAPWTKAASTAILTGHHALAVGMVEEGPRRNERVMPNTVTLLAERFSAAGYRTFGVTTNPNLHSSFGFARGFERYGQPEKIWGRDGGEKTSGTEASDFLLASLPAGGDPFYAQLMLVDAHAPFRHSGDFADDTLPKLVPPYRNTLGRLDKAVKHLVEGLESAGKLENTVLVFVNDHGEGLSYPEHHGKSHGRFLFPSSVGGVGIVVSPEIAPGTRVPGLASQIDLAPTIWSLAGLPPQSDWPGFDLSNTLTSGAASPRTEAHVDTWFRKASRTGSYTSDRFCQIALRGSELIDVNGVRFVAGCFDRASDPMALHPTMDPKALKALLGWRSKELAHGRRQGGASAAASADLDAQLEALGYAD